MYEIYCKLRDSKGLKDSDVVKATGITKSTFSDWKSGRSNPKDDKLCKIADFFNVSLDYLMTGKQPEFTVEMAEKDLALSNMNDRIKDYALKLSKMPKDKQDQIMSLIDMLSK